jgi:hypothetical protein
MSIFLINAGCLAIVGALAVLADMIFSDLRRRRKDKSRVETASSEPDRSIGASPR